MSSRRNARERVMQALYAFELGGGDADAILTRIVDARLRAGDSDNKSGKGGATRDAEGSGRDESERESDERVRRFAHALFLRTLDKRDHAEEIIRRHARNWELSRIALIDRLVLRMAICEIESFEDVPPKVSINEAIEVAKKFSTPNSGKFVNGILDSFVVELAQKGALRKSGRGLVGTESYLAGVSGSSPEESGEKPEAITPTSVASSADENPDRAS